jgi:hypothetical protein
VLKRLERSAGKLGRHPNEVDHEKPILLSTSKVMATGAIEAETEAALGGISSNKTRRCSLARNVQFEFNLILEKLFKYLKTFIMFHGERWRVIVRQGGRPGSNLIG